MKKLLKYEVRKTRFSKMILLILTFISEIIFLLGILFIHNEKWLIAGITCLVLCATFGTLLCGLHSVDQLQKELNSKQSYMLFMTPNNSYKILGAKVLENGISLTISGIFFSILASLDLFILFSRLEGVMKTINEILKSFGMIQIDPLNIVSALIVLLVGWLLIITIAYFSVILQASLLNGKRYGGFVSFIIFVGINIGLVWIVGFIPPVGSPIAASIIRAGIEIVIIVGFYAWAGWIMDKKISV